MTNKELQDSLLTLVEKVKYIMNNYKIEILD